MFIFNGLGVVENILMRDIRLCGLALRRKKGFSL